MKIKISFPSGLEIEIGDDAQIEPYKMILASKESETVPIGAVIQKVSSEHFEKAGILESPPVKKPEKVLLPKETRAEIMRLAERGLRPKEIARELHINDSRRVQGCIRAQALHTTRRSTEKEEASPEPLAGNVAESIPAPKDVAERRNSTLESLPGPVQDCAALQGGGSVGQLLEKPGCPGGDGPAQEGVPEASAYSPMAVNGQIWDLTRAGLSPAEIAGELHERGLQWTEDMVEKRLEKIRVGAA